VGDDALTAILPGPAAPPAAASPGWLKQQNRNRAKIACFELTTAT
jgi:hypothetical protein